MKRFILLSTLFVFSTALSLAQVTRTRTLAWDDPNTPGTVTKYTIYWGTQTGGPYTLGKLDIPVGTRTAQVSLPKGTYYFVVTAINPDSESPYSNEASTTIYDNSMKPINLIITVGP